MNTKDGESSEYSDSTVRSASPAINTVNTAATTDPFKSRPKLSRTPPNSTDNQSSDIKSNDHEFYDTIETFQSEKTSSPTLSIEYPPGSHIPMMKKRKKFQFKKSHYQRFIGTSSAKKTKEIRKEMERENGSRSNSLISCQSSAAVFDSTLTSFPAEFIETLNDSTNNINRNEISTAPIKVINQDSLPPSPPSDDLLSQIINKSPNKHPVLPSINVIHSPVLPSDKSVNSDDATDSSSPSLLQETNTTTTTQRTVEFPQTNPGYSYRYRSRQKWKTLINDGVKKRQNFEKTSTFAVSHRAPRKGKHINFGAKTEPGIDPDRIRLRLHDYDEQKGQNLEEIFRPQKTCWFCNIL